MNVWAIFGFVIAAILLFFLLMWVVQKAISRLEASSPVGGFFLIGTAMAYASYVTWLITSGNVPFLYGG